VVQDIRPGNSTASPLNVSYRIGRLAGRISGRWLDVGCADGGYTQALLSAGAHEVLGIDPDAERIELAKERLPLVSFQVAVTEELPFPDDYFDGVWMNEVFEHVADEERSLAELRRVIRPGGILVILTPNRWFPFEGHMIQIGDYSFDHPSPVVPWLPVALSRRWTTARNYWPSDLRNMVARAGFDLESTQFVMPVLEEYPWLPGPLKRIYQRQLDRLHDVRVVRHFGVSNLVVASPRK
jgi:SAM-dependent methyltransferase